MLSVFKVSLDCQAIRADEVAVTTAGTTSPTVVDALLSGAILLDSPRGRP